MDDELKQLVEDIYNEILHTTSLALESCKLLSLKELGTRTPSLTEISEYLMELAIALEVVYKMTAASGDAESFHKSAKAYEYALNIKSIAKAINEDDEASLRQHISDLDRRPFL